MGRFFVSKIWLEDREIEILEKYNFNRDVWESEIPEDECWILFNLECKGFLHSLVHGKRKYYQRTVAYSQHFNIEPNENVNNVRDPFDHMLPH